MIEATDGSAPISITHAEYRLAYARRIPLYSLVRSDVWDAWWRSGGDSRAARVAGIDPGVFDLLSETQASPRLKWIFPWTDTGDLETIIRSSFFQHDESAFAGDVTIPDGETFDPGERFEKVWAIRNVGFVPWESRTLRCLEPAVRLRPDVTAIEIERTPPGGEARPRVWFTAPAYPCTVRSEWKMFDADGRPCFPWMKGL